MSEQLALLSSSTVGLLEGSTSQDEEIANQGPGLDDGDNQLEEQASQSPQPIGESELSSPESSVVETENIPGVIYCQFLPFT